MTVCGYFSKSLWQNYLNRTVRDFLWFSSVTIYDSLHSLSDSTNEVRYPTDGFKGEEASHRFQTPASAQLREIRRWSHLNFSPVRCGALQKERAESGRRSSKKSSTSKGAIKNFISLFFAAQMSEVNIVSTSRIDLAPVKLQRQSSARINWCVISGFVYEPKEVLSCLARLGE